MHGIFSQNLHKSNNDMLLKQNVLDETETIVPMHSIKNEFMRLLKLYKP